MLAPRGLASLAAEKDALSKVVRPPSATKLPDRVDIDSEIARLVREEAGAEVRSEELAAAVANVRESVARLSSDADARRNRIAELEGRLPPPAVCTAHLSDARSKAALAKETLNAAVRSHAAWRSGQGGKG